MELRQLRYFIGIAEAAGLRRASQELRVAQPALSRQIHALEDELGVRLLERHAKGVVLSEAGRGFLPEARDILRRLEQASERARRAARGQAGTLRVGVSEAGAVLGQFRRTIQHFSETSEDIELSMFGLSSVHQIDALRRGSIDIGLMQGAPDDPRFGRVCAHRLVPTAAIPIVHRLADKQQINILDLEHEIMIWQAQSSIGGYYTALRDSFLSAGISPHIGHEVSTGAIVLSLVSAGLGVGIVLSEPAWRCPEDVVTRAIGDINAPFDLEFVWLKDNHSSILARFTESALLSVDDR